MGSGRGHRSLLLAGLVFLLLPSFPARADEDRLAAYRAELLRARVVDVGGEHRVEETPAGEVRHTLTGGVEIEIGRLLILADAVCLWHPRPGDEVPEIAVPTGASLAAPITAFYAEGDVLATFGGDSLRCDWLVFDAVAGVGEASRIALRSAGRGHEAPPGFAGLLPGVSFQARAERARLDGLSHFELEDVEVTPCTFDVLHVAIRCAWAEVTVGEEAAAAEQEPPGEDGGPAPSDADALLRESWIRLGPLTAWAFGVPFLWAPGAVWSPGWNPLVPRVGAGDSSRRGTFVRTRTDLAAYLAFAGAGIPRHLRADLLAEYYEERGPLAGLDLAYRGRWLTGRVEGVYIHDEGTDLGGIDPPTEDRGRIRSFARAYLPERIVLSGQLSWTSDPTFLREWFESELRREVAPATFIEARFPFGAQQVALSGRWRLAGFESAVEEIPLLSHAAARVRLFDLPTGHGVYWSQEATLANLRRQFARGGPPAYRAVRLDLTDRLAIPFDLGPVRVDPFAFGRLTAYDRGVQGTGDHPVRTVAGAGVFVSTEAHRTFHLPAPWLLGTTDLRHVVAPLVGYVATFADEVHPDDVGVLFFDGVEGVPRSPDYLVAELRNRLLTRAGGAASELCDLAIRETFLFPADDEAPRRFGDIEVSLRVYPTALADVDVALAIDPEAGFGVRALDARLLARPFPAVTISLAHRLAAGAYDATEVGAAIAVGERWALAGSYQYDFFRREPIGATFEIRRSFHDFAIAGRLTIDEGENDVSFSVNILPFGLDDAPDRPFGGAYVAPPSPEW